LGERHVQGGRRCNAVNGLAKRQGFKDIEPIWADDPETGLKKNIGPIIDRGLALCA
jgi:hypothetical protein